MSTKDNQYEHLNANQRSTIRREMLAVIREQDGDASYDDRFAKAVRRFARRYGVKGATIERIFRDTASLAAPVHGVLRMNTEPRDRSGAISPEGHLAVSVAPGMTVTEDYNLSPADRSFDEQMNPYSE